ncbi:MAG: KH domain-containing protein [Verrucomicrobiia bacterium]|jgi:predicted RNA-binding protein YlqC (UPF0109 family)
MKAFVEFVVKALVDYPEQVEIREVDGDQVVVFELRLNQTDIGKVIGKSGRTITAIRTLLTGAAAKQGKRAMIEIIEPDGPRSRGSGPCSEQLLQGGPSTPAAGESPAEPGQ